MILGVLAVPVRGALAPAADIAYAHRAAEVLRQHPDADPAMLEQGRAFGEAVGIAMSVAWAPLLIFATGVCIWILGRVAGSRWPFNAAMLGSALGAVPLIARQFATVIQGYVMSVDAITSPTALVLGPGRFLNPATVDPGVLAAAGELDVFLVWRLWVLYTAVSVLARVPRAGALLITFAALCLALWLAS